MAPWQRATSIGRTRFSKKSACSEEEVWPIRGIARVAIAVILRPKSLMAYRIQIVYRLYLPRNLRLKGSQCHYERYIRRTYKVSADTKPVLFTIDDDPAVLRAIERDLRRRYADRYRVLRADSGMAALEILSQLQLRNEIRRVFLCDQRMPSMTGVEFLERAKQIYPDARSVLLLTAYSDTEAAIDSINRVQINHYLLKPWDPPEQNLYPVIDDQLDDWQADYHPAFEGIRVVGARWSPQTHAIKDFLARNQIPYTWIDVESADSDPEAQRLLATLGDLAILGSALCLASGRLDT